jgi:hypothetical protein
MTDSVRIYCDEPSHEGKVVNIALFLRNAGSITRWHEWQASTARNRNQWEARAGQRTQAGVLGRLRDLPTKDKPHHYQVIYGNKPLEGPPINVPPAGHVKHAWVCELCGLDVQATEENLVPVLDTLGDADVIRISLKALGARLR